MKNASKISKKKRKIPFQKEEKRVEERGCVVYNRIDDVLFTVANLAKFALDRRLRRREWKIKNLKSNWNS